MQVATALTRSRNPIARVFNLWLVLVMLTSFTTFAAQELASPDNVMAVPALSVSTSVGDPLLGGTGGIDIDVTNTGDAKGYNLSFEVVISSSLLDPDGTVTIDGLSVDPSSITLDPVTGDTTIEVYDVVDLAPTESHTITIDYSIGGDSSWEVGDLVVVDVTAEVNDIPDNSGTWRQGVDSASGTVIPIDLVTKTPNQSTSVHQATGTQTRVYSYTLEIQNNYVNPSHSVVVTDTVPDGVEFLGPTSGPALDGGFPWRDPTSGETHLQWTLEPTTPGQMDPGENVIITYDTGIRYDYYGTGNGGNNRPHDVFDGRETTSTPVGHKDVFVNTALLNSEYKGSLPTSITPSDTETAQVTGAYVTIDKSGTPSVGGYGTVVDYTLVYYTSQYYSADNLTLTDTIGDGLSYVPGSASIAPDSVTHDPSTGETTLVWLPSTLDTITATAQQTITLQASMDTTWEDTPLAGQPIRAGDSMRNEAQLAADWHDQINPPRTGSDMLVAAVEAGITTRLPGIYKDVWSDSLSMWTSATAATVGDEIDYRVRFNTTDGVNPERTDITLGYITLTDWIPPGTSVVATRVPTVSSWADFSDTTTPTIRSINPTTPVDVAIGSLDGIEWFLGDVEADGWWETTFTVLVEDVVAVQDGLKTGNHWKLTGVNSFGQEYSDRDISDLSYVEPDLTIDKVVASAPSPLVASSDVTYTITVENEGTAAAGNVLVTDVLPNDMNDTAPTVEAVTLDGTPLVENTDYKVDWTANTLSVDFYDTGAPAVDTMLPAGETLVITVRATVDAHVGAGRQLTNTAYATWDSQNDGTGRSYGPINDPATITLSEPSISKQTDSGPIRVGDSYGSTVTVTVPAGAVLYWPEIQDRVANDGVYYVPASSSITDISGTPLEGARPDTTTPEPTRTNPADPRTEFRWLLANMIDNRGQATDYVFELSFDLQYTGVEDNGSQEMMPPTSSDRVINDRVRIAWGYDSPVARDTDDGRNNGTNRYTAVDQPVLVIDKSVAAPGPYAGGQIATYTSVISHDPAGSWNTAYDIFWEDVLDTYMGAPALQSITHSTIGDIVAGTSPDFSSPPTITVNMNGYSLDVGETITVVYTVIIDPNVPASAVQTNTADIDWSTMPGTPAGSRRYNDQSWEESWQTADTDLQTIPIAEPTIEKSVSGDPEHTFGGVQTVEITVTVPPETVLPATAIWDEIAIDGHIDSGLPWMITPVSGTPQIPALMGAPSPLFDSSPAPGTNVLFPLLLSVDNADPAAVIGDTPYVFKITYYPLFDGVADDSSWIYPPPITSMPVDDTAYLQWTVDGNNISVSATASIEADQPVLTLDKTVVTPGPYEGGDPVVYSSLITNVGDATAWHMSWEDELPAQMSTATFGGASHSVSGDISSLVTPDFTSPSTVMVDFNAIALPPGESITVTYTVDVDPGAGAGSIQMNTADVDWATVWMTRTYDDSAEETYTADTDIAFIQIALPSLSKTVQGGDTTRTVGEEFAFQIDFSIPASTTAYAVQIADTVPDGLTVEDASILSGPGAVAVGAKNPTTGETPVVWTVGNVTNPPDITLSLQVDVSMDDAFTATGVPLDGLLPVQDSLVNSATITWDDALIGGSTRERSAQATITVVEPELTITKATSESTLEASQWTTYTVTIDNIGTSAAHDVGWADKIAPELFEAGVSPSLNTVLLDSVALIPPGEYTYDFGTTTTSTVNLTGPIPAGSTLEIIYSAKMNGGVASGLSMPNTASVIWASQPATDGARTYGPIDDTETITSLAPALSITKTTSGDTHVQATGETEFTVAVTNIGDARARAVEVTDTLPAGFEYVPSSSSASWPSGSSTADPNGIEPAFNWDFGGAYLDPADTLTLTFRAQAQTSTIPGTYVNDATAIAEDGAGDRVAPVDDSSTVWVTRPGITVDKRLDPMQDPHVQVGQPVWFEIWLTNTGTTTIVDAPLTDTYDPAYLTPVFQLPPADWSVPGSLGWNDASGPGLAPGMSTMVWALFLATGNPWLESTIDTATVSGASDQWGDPIPSAVSTEPIDITAPSYSINKIVAPSQATTVSIGEMVEFEIGLTNTGDSPLMTLPLTDAYQSTFSFVSASPSEDSSMPGTLAWADVIPATLAPGETTTVTATFQALSEDLNAANAAIGSNAQDAWGDTALAPPPSVAEVAIVAPSLTITKTVDNPSLGPGETTTYTVTWENLGSGPAHDIAITDRIPDELFASGSSPALDAILVDGVPLAPMSYIADFSSSATATVNLLVPLPAGSTLAMVYNVTLNGGHPAGLTLTNDVSTTYSSLPGAVVGEAEYGPISDSVDIVTRAPELAITKVSTGDNELQAGQSANYRVQIVNVGDAPAYSVVVTDTLDPNMSYSTGSSLATWSGPTTSTADPIAVGQLLTWDFSGLAYLSAGETMTLDYAVSVDASPVLGWSPNAVGGGADDGGGVPVASVEDTESVLITDPSAAIDKHLAPGQDAHIQVGQNVSFEIVVTNDGTTDIDWLPLEDTYDPTYLEFVSATPSIDSTGVGSLGWVDLTDLGLLAVGESTTVTVEFTAIAHPPTSSTLDTATVVGAVDEYSDPVPDVSDTAEISITEPSVAIEKTLAVGQDSMLMVGETVDFDLAVTNTGDTTLTVVPVTDTFDLSALEYVSASTSPSAISATTIDWTDITVAFGDMAPGQTETITVQFQSIAETASGVNTATVQTSTDLWDDPAPGNSSQSTITAFAPGSLTFEKSSDPASGTIMLPGEIITYYVTFANASPAPVPNVFISDIVPQGVRYVADSMSVTRGGTTTEFGDAERHDLGEIFMSFEGDVIVSFGLGDVATDETITVSFQVEVSDAEFSRQGILNSATLTVDSNKLMESNEVYHPVDPFDIFKTAEDLNGGQLEAGDEILWTIEVVNTGIVPTTNTIIRDTVPAETTYVTDSITGTGADESNAPDLMWMVGDIPVGESVIVTFISTVNAGLPSGTEILNQASAQSDQSALKFSDFPDTPEMGDATLLTTGGPDWLWLLLAMLSILGGGLALYEGRRRRNARSRAAHRAAMRGSRNTPQWQ